MENYRQISSIVEAAVKKAMKEQNVSTMDMKEVCNFLHVQRVTVYRRIKQGLLHPKKNGGRVLFIRSEVENLIK